MRHAKLRRFSGRHRLTGVRKQATWLLAVLVAAAAITVSTTQRAFAGNCSNEQNFFVRDAAGNGTSDSYGTAIRMWVKNHEMDSSCSTPYDWSMINVRGTDINGMSYQVEFGYFNSPGDRYQLAECWQVGGPGNEQCEKSCITGVQNTYDYFKVAEYPIGTGYWDSWMGYGTSGYKSYFEVFPGSYYGAIYPDTSKGMPSTAESGRYGNGTGALQHQQYLISQISQTNYFWHEPMNYRSFETCEDGNACPWQ